VGRRSCDAMSLPSEEEPMVDALYSRIEFGRSGDQ
jgi:hypothetical protein